MEFIADLHLHSRFSRATSKSLDLVALHRAAQLKGLTVLGTGDFTHPGWFAELEDRLLPAEDGLFALRPELARTVEAELPRACRGPVRFLLSVEISNIYKRDGRTRKVHNLVLMPSLDAARRFTARLARIGNVCSDGRPILGLDSHDLLEIVLETSPEACLVPAHIWTPWFSVLGSLSGFDSLEECFAELTPHIFAVETGLSSDPPMNWRFSGLDGLTLISNSDAHSPEKLGREANLFDCELSYPALLAALRAGGPSFGGTIEFFPEEGKYHLDGHRKCEQRLEPERTRELGGLCPACGKPVTVGVLHRVAALADRPAGVRAPRSSPFHRLIPLAEVVGELLGQGPATAGVRRVCDALAGRCGPELLLLRRVPLEEIGRVGSPLLAEAVRRMRQGDVRCEAGYDGEYGTIRLFAAGELREREGQLALQVGQGSRPQGPGTATGTGAGTGTATGTGAGTGPGTATGTGAGAGTGTGAATGTGTGTSAGTGTGNGAAAPPPPVGESRRHAAAAARGREPGEQDRAGDDPSAATATGGQGCPPGGELPAAAPGLRPALGDPCSRLLAGLDEAQQQVVLHAGPEPLLVVAGPGSGKTRTLTRRIAFAVLTGRLRPEEVLAVTFTVKAASEMRQRLERLLGPEQTARMTIGTFHGICHGMLAAHGARVGLPPGFVLLDAGAQLACLERVASRLELRPGGRRGSSRDLDEIARARAHGLGPEAHVRGANADGQRLACLHRAYLAELAACGATDFDGLLEHTCALLTQDLVLRSEVCGGFRLVAVDEYQDVNRAQVGLVRAWAGADGEGLCAIGDPDQAIYGFRGAQLAHFLAFSREWPTARVLRLERSYRCSDTILSASRQALQKAAYEGGALWSGIAGERQITIFRAPSEQAEAEYVARAIEQAVGGTGFYSLDSGRVEEDGRPAGLGFSDIAVLYRTHALAAPLVEALERAGIPLQRARHGAAGDEAELLLQAALRAAAAPGLLLPDLASLARALEPEGTSRDDEPGAQEVEAPLDEERLGRSAALVDELRTALGPQPRDAPVGAALDQAAHLLAGAGCGPGAALQQAARRLAAAVPPGERLAGLLARLALLCEGDDLDPRAERVSLMTLHAAKGLEFALVFIVGCEDGFLPHRPGGGGAKLAAEEIEEERRLLYVGMTRARQKLVISWAERRSAAHPPQRQPSPFLDDIEESLCRHASGGGRARRPRPAEDCQLGLDL